MSGATPPPDGPLTSLDLVAVRRWAVLTRSLFAARRVEIDALNVFPVPDGDTGTNLYLTFDGAVERTLATADVDHRRRAAGGLRQAPPVDGPRQLRGHPQPAGPRPGRGLCGCRPDRRPHARRRAAPRRGARAAGGDRPQGGDHPHRRARDGGGRRACCRARSPSTPGDHGRRMPPGRAASAAVTGVTGRPCPCPCTPSRTPRSRRPGWRLSTRRSSSRCSRGRASSTPVARASSCSSSASNGCVPGSAHAPAGRDRRAPAASRPAGGCPGAARAEERADRRACPSTR